MPSKSIAQQHLSLEDAAYIAGFFDGEGSVGIRAHNKPGTKGGHDRQTPHYRLVIAVANTNRNIIDWLVEKCGGSSFEKHRSNPKWAPAFEFRLSNRAECYNFLTMIKDFVRVKTKQVELGLEFLKLGLANIDFEARGKTWPYRSQNPEDINIRENFKQRMNILNRRGVEDASSQ